MTEPIMNHGLAANFTAPHSGSLDREAIEKSLALLPEYKKELGAKWNSIGTTRPSGLAPIFEGGPLDDAVRDGAWQPDLQIHMPTAGGFPGSRGHRLVWPHGLSSNVASRQNGSDNFKKMEAKKEKIKRLVSRRTV